MSKKISASSTIEGGVGLETLRRASGCMKAMVPNKVLPHNKIIKTLRRNSRGGAPHDASDTVVSSNDFFDSISPARASKKINLPNTQAAVMKLIASGTTVLDNTRAWIKEKKLGAKGAKKKRKAERKRKEEMLKKVRMAKAMLTRNDSNNSDDDDDDDNNNNNNNNESDGPSLIDSTEEEKEAEIEKGKEKEKEREKGEGVAKSVLPEVISPQISAQPQATCESLRPSSSQETSAAPPENTAANPPLSTLPMLGLCSERFVELYAPIIAELSANHNIILKDHVCVDFVSIEISHSSAIVVISPNEDIKGITGEIVEVRKMRRYKHLFIVVDVGKEVFTTLSKVRFMHFCRRCPLAIFLFHKECCLPFHSDT